MKSITMRAWFLTLLFVFCHSVSAKTVDIPLSIKHPLLTQLITEQLFTGKNKTMRVGDDGSGCQFLELSQLKTTSQKGLLKIRSKAYARLGKAWGSQCMLFWEWRGQVELLERLSITGDGNQIKADVVESRLLTPQGQVDEVNNTLWQWVSTFLKPAFEQTVLDIRQPIQDTKDVVAQTLVKMDQKLSDQILNSIKIRRLTVVELGVQAAVSVDLPEAPELQFGGRA